MYGRSAGDQNLRTQEQESLLRVEMKGWFGGGGAAEADNHTLVIVYFHTVDALLYKMLRGTVTTTWTAISHSGERILSSTVAYRFDACSVAYLSEPWPRYRP
jgi:hypothetical protein